MPSGVDAGDNIETVVSIDDDDDPHVTVSYQYSTYTVAESDDASTDDIEENKVVVTVVISADPERRLTIPITMYGREEAEADPDEDYTDDDLEAFASNADYSVGRSRVIFFDGGSQERNLVFTARHDTEDDDGESVILGFGTLPTRVTEGANGQAEVTIVDDDELPVTVSFEKGSYTVAESDDTLTTDVQEDRVVIKVLLDAAPGRSVRIPIIPTERGGATDVDYTGVPGHVTFGSSETEKSFTFRARHDTDDDDRESVLLDFGTLPEAVSAGDKNTATVSITDDDDPEVTVRFEKSSYTVAESDETSSTDVEENVVAVKVVLSADPERTVTIPIVDMGQGGATSADYSVDPTSVTFNPGETVQTVTFTATHDTVDDDDESVLLSFGSPLPFRVSEADTNKQAVVYITDDDKPTALTVNFDKAAHTVAEGDTVKVRVTLSDDPEMDLTINISTDNQNGASDSDYILSATSVTFKSGDTEKEVEFTAVNDTEDDDRESVKLSFDGLPTSPINVTAGDTDESVVSITDDDDPHVTVSFEKSSYTVAESDDTLTNDIEENKVVVRVVLSEDPERTVTVPIVDVGQNGAGDEDYSGVPPDVIFNPGETVKTFTFAATDDTVDDDGERVSLTFGPLQSRVNEGTTNEAVVSITDDDKPTSLIVDFEQSSYTVAEGGSVTVAVTLSDDPERNVTIQLGTADLDGATSADYSGVPGDVTFGPGETRKTFTFTAVDDTEDDDDESVKIAFRQLPTSPVTVTRGTTDETVVNITDDDDPQVTVSFEKSTYTVAESDDTSTDDIEENKVVVRVLLSADPKRTVTVPIVDVGQNGAGDEDYSGVLPNVIFNPGETVKTFTFTAVHDTVDDDGESVKLSFGSLQPRVTEGATDEAVVSITDDDKPTSLTVNFEQSSYTVAEGGSVTVAVTLSDDPERNVTIQLGTTDQDGATSADYSGVPGDVTFGPGETRKTFTFTAVNDTEDDDEEKVKIAFRQLPTSPVTVTGGTTDETVVNITDDDVPAVTVSFEQSSYTVAESDNTSTNDIEENKATIKVVLSADPERTVTIQIDKANLGGATSADYSVAPENVVFNRGETEKSIEFVAAHDTDDDDDEKVRLSFVSLPEGVSEGTPGEAVVNITDDDDPEVTVSFEKSSYTVAESDDSSSMDVEENKATIKVVLSADPERTVTIQIDKANLGGATSADYSVAPGNVVFNRGETEKSIEFIAAHDTDDDDEEKVRLSFVSLPPRVSEGATGEAVVNITDDDDPEVTVSFEKSSYTVAESDDSSSMDVEENKATIKVVLSADPERTVTIQIDKANLGGATSADYSVAPGNVVFNRGETEKSIEFIAAHDTEDDDEEKVRLSFVSLPPRVSEGATDEAVVNITDDDDPEVTVSFERSSYTVAESDNTSTNDIEENKATIKVVLSADPERTVTIQIDKANLGGATSADYSVAPGIASSSTVGKPRGPSSSSQPTTPKTTTRRRSG